jgi:hypothetical protein
MLKPSFTFHLAVPGRAMAAVLLSGLSLSLLAGLAGCKAADFTGGTTDTSTVAADSAVLRVTNGIEQDPGPLTILLYSKSSMDLTNAVLIKKLGTVPYQGTVSMKVPAGTWKLGRANEAGVVTTLIDADAPEEEWLQCLFKKDGDYSLIFATDGNRTVWHPTFETIPALE